MQGAVSEFVALNKTGVNAAVDGAFAVASGLERLARLQLETARALFNETVQAWRTLASGASPIGSTPKATGLAIERMAGYSRNVFDIVSSTSVQVLELIATTRGDVRKDWVRALDRVSDAAGLGRIGGALESALSVPEAVLEGLTRIARQSVELVDSRRDAAASAASGVMQAPAPAKG